MNVVASGPAFGDVEEGIAAFAAHDYITALREFRQAAAEGNPVALHRLAGMYLEGEGVTQNYPEALKVSRLGAEQGLAWAQNNIGFLYHLGLGGLKADYKEAMKWYRLAAEQGHANAQNNIGSMYKDGLGAAQDY